MIFLEKNEIEKFFLLYIIIKYVISQKKIISQQNLSWIFKK
jgi:hypothetical protein